MALIQVIHLHANADPEVSLQNMQLATDLLVENERIKMQATALMSMGYVAATAMLVALAAWVLTLVQDSAYRLVITLGFTVGCAALAICLFWQANSKLKALRAG